MEGGVSAGQQFGLLSTHSVEMPGHIVIAGRGHVITIIEQPFRRLGSNALLPCLQHVHEPIHGPIDGFAIVRGEVRSDDCQLHNVGPKEIFSTLFLRLFNQDRLHQHIKPIMLPGAGCTFKAGHDDDARQQHT